MATHKQELRNAFENARNNFFVASGDETRKADLGVLAREAWDTRRAMVESGLFSCCDLMMWDDEMETISAIATLSRIPSPREAEFYGKLAQKLAF